MKIESIIAGIHEAADYNECYMLSREAAQTFSEFLHIVTKYGTGDELIARTVFLEQQMKRVKNRAALLQAELDY